MAGGTERTRHAVLGADQYPRCSTHRPGDNHRLADLLIFRRQSRRTRPECPRRTLTMDTHFDLFAIHRMGFKLAHVMSDIVDLMQVPVTCAGCERLFERSSC